MIQDARGWCTGMTSLFFKTPFPGWVSIPTSFVFLFIFYILSYLLLKTMGCFSGCLMSSASIQKLFCGLCSALKCSFDEFVGEKIVSPSYSSTILGPPQSLFYYTKLKFSCSSSVKIFTWSCYPTPGHVTRENNNSKRYTAVFTAALSTIVKTWRQPICPLTDKKCGIFIECNNAQP